MKEDDDDRPKKKITHEIGQDLYLLSVKELEERIALLSEEIERLKASIAEQAIVARRRGFVFQEIVATSFSAREARRARDVDDAKAAPRGRYKIIHLLNVLLSFPLHY